MAELTLQNIDPTGLNPAYTAVNSSDTMKISTAQRAFLHVKNGSGGSINVTVTAVKTSASVAGVGNVTISDEVVAVPAGEDRMIGPFTEAFINTDSEVTIGYSATASVTAAALQLPAQY